MRGGPFFAAALFLLPAEFSRHSFCAAQSYRHTNDHRVSIKEAATVMPHKEDKLTNALCIIGLIVLLAFVTVVASHV